MAVMGCASTKGTSQVITGNDVTPADDPNGSNNRKYPPAEAFTVPLDDEIDDNKESIIRKHPPKRLERLMEKETNSSPTTIEDLQEKLANAEIRRQKILQHRSNTMGTVKESNAEIYTVED